MFTHRCVFVSGQQNENKYTLVLNDKKSSETRAWIHIFILSLTKHMTLANYVHLLALVCLSINATSLLVTLLGG